MIKEFLSLFGGELFLRILNGAWMLAPIWVPLLVLITWFDLWLTYKRKEYIKSQGATLLEIRIPREMTKSPLAMELFINSLYNPAVGTLLDVYLKGKTRVWYSFELVSIDGAVHFYIWTQEANKNRVEAQLYAQFPNVEVHEVEDYALKVHHNPQKVKFGYFGQFGLTKKDPYPIKTYVDYGLDKDPDEEFKIDPIVSTLEFLGSLKKGEQAWIQIMVQAHTKEGLKYGRIFTKPDWKSAAEKEIKEIVKKGSLKSEDDKRESMISLTKAQQDTIAAIERSISKNGFDTMIRATYFAEPEVFNPSNIGGLFGSIFHYNSNTLNGFKPVFGAGFEYPWQDFRGRKKIENEKRLLDAYKRRSFFNTPYRNFHAKPFVMTAEELATIYHFPGEVAATPTLARLPSKKAEAPANLPI
jgi:hypothetical protein